MKDSAKHLLRAFDNARLRLGECDPCSDFRAVIGKNARGDVTRAFDLKSEAAVVEYCRDHVSYAVAILSEESGEQATRPDVIPAERWILDPVDGSENFARDLGVSGFSIAVSASLADVTVNGIDKALIGDLATGDAVFAQKGRGAMERTGDRCRVSSTTRLGDAVVSCDMNYMAGDGGGRVRNVIRACRDIRRMGSTVWELMMVARGRLDGYVDVRSELSAENFLAAALVIREAGGIITDEQGGDWGVIPNLLRGYSIVAAGTPELHTELLTVVQDKVWKRGG